MAVQSVLCIQATNRSTSFCGGCGMRPAEASAIFTGFRIDFLPDLRVIGRVFLESRLSRASPPVFARELCGG